MCSPAQVCSSSLSFCSKMLLGFFFFFLIAVLEEFPLLLHLYSVEGPGEESSEPTARATLSLTHPSNRPLLRLLTPHTTLHLPVHAHYAATLVFNPLRASQAISYYLIKHRVD